MRLRLGFLLDLFVWVLEGEYVIGHTGISIMVCGLRTMIYSLFCGSITTHAFLKIILVE